MPEMQQGQGQGQGNDLQTLITSVGQGLSALTQSLGQVDPNMGQEMSGVLDHYTQVVKAVLGSVQGQGQQGQPRPMEAGNSAGAQPMSQQMRG